MINIVVFLLSLVIEEIQYIYGREYSIDDIYKNCLGSSLAILFHPKIASDKRRVKIALQALTVIILLVALYPLTKNTIDWFYGRFSFPILSNFETPFEKERWVGQDLTVLKLESNNHALGNTFDTAKYSTLAFTHFANPWLGYYCFKYRVYNPYSNKVRLTTRINDRLHNEPGRNFNDRFNLSLDVLPGWNQFAIDIDKIRSAPRTRLMDMSKIQEIMFFTSDLKTGVTLYFDDLELSNDKSQCTALKNP